ncbi:hypothetical protein MTO96_047372 [Rhipicephalus appendiculatus]
MGVAEQNRLSTDPEQLSAFLRDARRCLADPKTPCSGNCSGSEEERDMTGVGLNPGRRGQMRPPEVRKGRK